MRVECRRGAEFLIQEHSENFFRYTIGGITLGELEIVKKL